MSEREKTTQTHMQSQIFNAEINGDVAARDVNSVHVQQVDVHVYASAQPDSRGESVHLAKAKALMPPVCHDELEWLAKHSDVHAACLLLACKNKVLVCKNGRLDRAAAFPDYSMGGMTIATVLAFFAWVALVLLAYKLSQSSQSILFGLMGACTLTIWWLQRQFFYPHVVAKKAVAALAGKRAA